MKVLHHHKEKPSPTDQNDSYSKPLFIVGYMASGKTTFGTALAAKTGRPFIDLDNLIEVKYNKSVADIFASEGEDSFRLKERDILRETITQKEAIIACGGGTPCFFNNMDFINMYGISVFLETSPEILLRRLVEENSKRPLVRNRSAEEIKCIINEQLKRRLPYYEKSQIRWNGNHLESLEEIEKNIKEFIEHYPFVFSVSFL